MPKKTLKQFDQEIAKVRAELEASITAKASDEAQERLRKQLFKLNQQRATQERKLFWEGLAPLLSGLSIKISIDEVQLNTSPESRTPLDTIGTPTCSSKFWHDIEPLLRDLPVSDEKATPKNTSSI